MCAANIWSLSSADRCPLIGTVTRSNCVINCVIKSLVSDRYEHDLAQVIYQNIGVYAKCVKNTVINVMTELMTEFLRLNHMKTNELIMGHYCVINMSLRERKVYAMSFYGIDNKRLIVISFIINKL